jgi:DNA-binding beta-propeller fold protein YncE
MKRHALLALLGILLVAALALAAPTGPPRAQVFVLSNSQPNISVIDAETNRVTNTVNVPSMTSWPWNDDNNYFDGTHLWLGMRNPSTNDVEVGLLNLDTLRIDHRIPLGQDRVSVYIGKSSRTGRLFVAKHASGQLAAINIKTRAVERTIDLPVGTNGVACDVEVTTGLDRRERAYIPTMAGNRVISVDTSTLQILQVVDFTENTRPFMLTATPDGRRLWVQEQTGNTNVVMSTMNLQVVDRVAAGRVPIVGTFSPDGKLHFTGHGNEPFVIANDTDTFREVWRAPAGQATSKVGVHPAGTFVYAIASNEGALVVFEAATGKVVTRIALGTNPTGLFVRRLN